MADLKQVSQKARNSAFLRWIYGNLTCVSQEHMQTFGYLAAMLPTVVPTAESVSRCVDEAIRLPTMRRATSWA